MPAVNAVVIPPSVSTEAAAVMMCSTVTVLHALRRGAFQPGARGGAGRGEDSVSLRSRWRWRSERGEPICRRHQPGEAIRCGTPRSNTQSMAPATWSPFCAPQVVWMSRELVGIADLIHVGVASLAPGGRVVAVRITTDEFGLDPFRDLVLVERSVIGSADHLSSPRSTRFWLLPRAGGSTPAQRLPPGTTRSGSSERCHGSS